MTDQNHPLTAEIRVPISKDIGGPARVEEIPLPPPELWGELENSDTADKEPPAPALEQPAKPAEIATLDFVVATHKSVPLKFPFRFEGRVVERIDVCRLTTGEVDEFIRAHQGGFTTFDVYAFMTGFPAAVLRGLVAEDGDAVTDAAVDFLPRTIRDMFAFPAS